ncbi:phenylalanine--tRNA ligase subunit alpha [candidate division TA06 bacterium B3_TA06]|uniref:Phenylalanine--tRNA ligase alpha subunit n=1 Tax=candidate division TA06 bacterium B3_TA06 TaxID=2012487 RepID=A0A532VAI1_UNCT6|nr:MAG: phenylalanine--tRNA ligase subunit alpha [candidate division TA06 bacterium B3_TA06]
MQERLALLKKQALAEIAAASTPAELERLRIRYMGRKAGELTLVLRSLEGLSEKERRSVGQTANALKNELAEALEKRRAQLETKSASEAIDLTLPGRKRFIGYKHPITLVTDRIVEIFVGMGFEEILGPEIETDWYNFEALNIPEGHPARGEMFGNFYLPGGLLLRSHTSPVQIRVMEKMPPPVRVIAPGRVYRRDAFDSSHSPVFYQVEGLYVDEGVSLADLKGTLEVFSQEIFGSDIGVRFSPSYFPFTEPSAELSISCVICGGEGCKVCAHTGWVEILGCGMVHPQVLRNVGYDPERVSGFAFGMGVERIAMIHYRIDDIRHFYSNDLRFLRQFRET